MTESEAIKYLRQIYPNGGHSWLDSQRIEAIEMAITALSQPSLPFDLDEAAHHSAVMVLNNPAFLPNAPFSEILKILDGLFKAGAEWMAGQGETRDDIVVTGDFDNKAHIFPIPSSKFNPGDKVVVQIRKK